MDNIDVATLTRVNDLAQAYGVKPYEFVATISKSLDMEGHGLAFQIPGETNKKQRAKVEQMLQSIGVDDKGILKGGEIAVIDALDAALQRAPKSRSRY